MATTVIASGIMHTAPALKQRILCTLVPTVGAETSGKPAAVFEGVGTVIVVNPLVNQPGAGIRATVDLSGEVPDALSWTLLTWKPLPKD